MEITQATYKTRLRELQLQLQLRQPTTHAVAKLFYDIFKRKNEKQCFMLTHKLYLYFLLW